MYLASEENCPEDSVGLIFFNLNKAFDTICLDILLSKLKHYGFVTKIKSLIISFLLNKRHYVYLVFPKGLF